MLAPIKIVARPVGQSHASYRLWAAIYAVQYARTIYNLFSSVIRAANGNRRNIGGVLKNPLN